MKLTDATIRALKPSAKPIRKSDGHGLYIEVTPSGAKLWKLAYRFSGKQKNLSIGQYPAVGLAAARQKAIDAREQIANGIDPSAEKQRIKAETREREEKARWTFRAVADEWLTIKKGDWSESNHAKITGYIEKLCPFIGDVPMADLKPPAILEAIRPYEACGKLVTARTLAQTASQVCRFARTCGYCEFNAADGLTSVIRKVETKHRACLTSPEEVGELLRAIDEYQGGPSVLYALKILPYVALRSTELRGAAWSEIDLENALWIVPAARKKRVKDGGGMKMRVAHEVPLARQVVGLFRELKAIHPEGLCFPGRNSKTDCITDNALLVAIRRLGYGKEEMSIHGFRGIFSTLLNEQKAAWGIDTDAIEKQLAHVQASQVRAAYNHADYLEQRRALMQRWADYLDELRQSGGSNHV